MIASTLLSMDIVPLRTSDTGSEALSIMSDFYVKHLPIVNNEELLGLLSEDDILDNDVEEAVGSYQLSISKPYVKDNDHLYEVLRVMSDHNLSVVPVVDSEQNYLGLITQEDLLRFFAKSGSFTEPGSIIVIEISKRDYSLSEIARIVESENAAILSSFITTNLESTRVDVTLKINKQDISRILASLVRYEYQIKASFQESQYFDTLSDRFDSLMTYLNI
ncbi:MAG: CBS domain-containing protein [Saprospiraceae bacterium]